MLVCSSVVSHERAGRRRCTTAVSFQVMPVVMVAGLPVTQARDPGLQPFCVTVDRQAGEYLPHLFGSGGYVVIHCPSQLPRELPLLYARLTA
jgi:hypothetical protein